jgi:hypothetical protein
MRIAEYLDHQLDKNCRVLHMTALADRVAACPAGAVLDDLRAVLEVRVLSGEDHQRLHILLSQLYHAHADVDGALVRELRDVVTTVWETSRTWHPTGEGGDVDVLLEP